MAVAQLDPFPAVGRRRRRSGTTGSHRAARRGPLAMRARRRPHGHGSSARRRYGQGSWLTYVLAVLRALSKRVGHPLGKNLRAADVASLAGLLIDCVALAAMLLA